MNCFADINGGIGVRVSGNDMRWIGGLIIGAFNSGSEGEIGLQFVTGPEGPAGCVIDTKVMGCGTAAVDFGADKGNIVRASLWQPDPTKGWIGTPSAQSQVALTQKLGDVSKTLVIQSQFDLREQATPAAPFADSVRVFARDSGGKTQLCALFPNGTLKVLAAEA